MKKRKLASRRLRWISLIGAVAIAAAVGLGLLRSSDWDSRNALSNLDLFLLDQKFRLRGPLKPGNAITIVAIDDKTLTQYGSMRLFSRQLWAQFITALSTYQPRVMATDILWSEPDPSHPEYDQAFADAIAKAGNVVLSVHARLARTSGTASVASISSAMNPLAAYESGKNVHPIESDQAGAAPEKIQGLFVASTVQPDLPGLMQACRSFGLVNSNPDATGRLRYAPTVIEYGGAFYPILSLQALKMYWGGRNLYLDLARDRIEQIRFDQEPLPTDGFGRMLINYRGPRGTYRTVSMADVLAHRVPFNSLNGKLVLVGATSLGLSDVFATPFDRTMPGVEMHATVIDSIMQGQFLRQGTVTSFVDLALVVVLALLLGFLLPRFSARNSILFALLLLAAFAAFNEWMFVRWGWVLSFAFPGLAIVATSSFIVGCKYLTEERQRAQIKRMFQYYLDEKVVERLLEQPESPKLEGEERELTVLFSDIRNFTSFSEKLLPAQLTALLNDYLTEMSKIILKHEGVLDKFIGDAIMAFWGAPLDAPRHAELACAAALEMVDRLRSLRERWEPVIGMPFNIGLGLNSGLAAVGNMGSVQRFNYTALGDNVNLASRLEGLNKFYRTNILISENTYQQVKDRFQVRRLDYVRVKGRQDAVMLYELLAPKETAGLLHSLTRSHGAYSKKFLQEYEDGMDFYLSGKVAEALAKFRAAQEENGNHDGATDMLIARCEAALQAPLEDFSPAYQFEEK